MDIFSTVLDVCSEHLGISKEAIVSPTRKQDVVTARFMTMKFAKKYTTLSLASIGMKTGDRHYSTVINALKQFDDLYDTISAFKSAANTIERKLELALAKDLEYEFLSK